MHTTIDVRFKFSSDDQKMLPEATLAEFITEQDVEATILEAIIEQLDVQRVKDYCGKNPPRATATTDSNAPGPGRGPP